MRMVGPTKRGGRLYASRAVETEGDEAGLARSLIGRTITDAVFFDSAPDDDWTSHEECLLWLDDGRVVSFGAWGHDAWGATLDEEDPASPEVVRWQVSNHSDGAEE